MRKIFLLSTCLLLLFSCRKDGDQYHLQTGIFPSNALTASEEEVVLMRDAENETAIEFGWKEASFGQLAVVGYVLEFGTVADTANNWATARTMNISGDALNYAFIVKDLNGLLNEMGMEPNIPHTMAFRIRANVNQYNGAASTIPASYSNTVTPLITSYPLDLYVPGDYQGWNPAAAPKLAPVPGRAGLYEGYVYMKEPGQHYFKYTNAPDWNHTNYGDGGNGSFSTDGNAPGLSVPDGGYYYLTANFNTNKWTATKVEWGILGDASPGSWNNDTPLSYDEVSQTWKLNANMLKNGSFKFRANKAWELDFALDANNRMRYANNPFLGYTDGLNNFTVPEDGNYDITLDLHQPGNYSYQLVKH
jgi:starch-binding outer membrane protein SusE/F